MKFYFSKLRYSVSKIPRLGSGFRGPQIPTSLSCLIQSGRKQEISFFGKNSRYLSYSASVAVSEADHEEIHDETKETEKDRALHSAILQLTGDTDTDSTMSMLRFFRARNVPVISTGSLKLDTALGIGGLPRGRFVEIYGQEGSGKTTLALHIIKEAQKLGGFCAYFDVENAMSPSLAESMGLDTSNLLISRPDSAENLLSAVDSLTKSGSVDVIVVDSVAALVPQCEVDASIGDSTIFRRDYQSRIMSQALRTIHYSLNGSQTLIVFVNQVRRKHKPGSDRVHEETCGGNALKFYAAVRLQLRKAGVLQIGDEVSGLRISVQVVKNKLAPAMKKAELGLQFGRGFCIVSEALDLACEHGIIVIENGEYFIEGKTFSDRLEAKRFLADNEAVLDNVVSILQSQLF